MLVNSHLLSYIPNALDKVTGCGLQDSLSRSLSGYVLVVSDMCPQCFVGWPSSKDEKVEWRN